MRSQGRRTRNYECTFLHRIQTHVATQNESVSDRGIIPSMEARTKNDNKRGTGTTLKGSHGDIFREIVLKYHPQKGQSWFF